MGHKRINICLIKKYRSYSRSDLADGLGVDKNTILNWEAEGMKPIDAKNHKLYHSDEVRRFLSKRRTANPKKVGPAQFICMSCKQLQNVAPNCIRLTVNQNPVKFLARASCNNCGREMCKFISQSLSKNLTHMQKQETLGSVKRMPLQGTLLPCPEEAKDCNNTSPRRTEATKPKTLNETT
jgi:hypothetical protein